LKILITGALGHIGSSLLRYLGKSNNIEKIYLIDNLVTQRYCSIYNLPDQTPYSFLELDLAKCALEDIPKSDYIIHLAAKTDAAQSSKYEKEFYLNNLEASKKIINFTKKNNSKLIFASSTSVYGPQSELVDENCSDKELNPQSPYADIKLKEEKIISDILTVKNAYLILRLGTIYGFAPGIRFHTAVNKFCFQASLGHPLTIWKTAYEQKRPYLGLSDFNSAILHIIDNDLVNNQIYNLVSHNMKVREIVEIIKQKCEVSINYVNHAIMNQLSYEVSNKRLSNTGYKFCSNIKNEIFEILDNLQNLNE